MSTSRAEDQHQRAIIAAAPHMKFDLGDRVAFASNFITAVPNGGYRRKAEAAILKGTGVRPGYPDLIGDIARGPYHGFRVELKKRVDQFRSKSEARRAVSDNQRQCLHDLSFEGYACAVCYGQRAFWGFVSMYMSGSAMGVMRGEWVIMTTEKFADREIGNIGGKR